MTKIIFKDNVDKSTWDKVNNLSDLLIKNGEITVGTPQLTNIIKNNNMTNETPKHYKFKIEPLTFITENNLSFIVGNIIKYVCRYDKKDGVKDLLKAKDYLEKLIEAETLKSNLQTIQDTLIKKPAPFNAGPITVTLPFVSVPINTTTSLLTQGLPSTTGNFMDEWKKTQNKDYLEKLIEAETIKDKPVAPIKQPVSLDAGPIIRPPRVCAAVYYDGPLPIVCERDCIDKCQKFDIESFLQKKQNTNPKPNQVDMHGIQTKGIAK